MNSIPSKHKILTRASRESKIKLTKREYIAQSNSPSLKSNNIKINNKIVPDIFQNISIDSQINSHCILNNFQYNTPTNNNTASFFKGNNGIKLVNSQNIKQEEQQKSQQNQNEQQSPEQIFNQPNQIEENQQLKFHFHSLSPSNLSQQNCGNLSIRYNQNSYNQILDNFIDQSDKIIKKVQERKILNIKNSNNNLNDIYNFKSNKFNYDKLEFKINVQGKNSQEKNSQQQNIYQQNQLKENTDDLNYQQTLKRSESIFNKIQFQKRNNNFSVYLKDKQQIQNKENIVDNIAVLPKMNYYPFLNNKETYKKEIQSYREYTKRDQIGQLENQNKEILNEPFDYNNFNNLGQKWDKFIGLKYEDSNLRGILILSNGEKWEGLFKNGLLNGEGVFTQQNGNLVKGKWINDKLEQQY